MLVSGISHQLLIVCDHPLLCHGLTQLVEAAPDLEVCCTAKDVESAVELIAKREPDLVIVDIAGKSLRLVRLIRELHARFPQLPLLALSSYSEPVCVRNILRAGAAEFVPEGEAPAKLTAAVRRLLAKDPTRETF